MVLRVGGAKRLPATACRRADDQRCHHDGRQLCPGVVAQSIGGGGGVAGLVAANGIATGANGLKTDLGSFGGPGGAGGAANVTILSGFIMTTGLMSPAVIAQSIGGGGGLTGFVNGGAAPVGLTEAVLGSRGGSGSASAVSVSNLAGIMTNNAGALCEFSRSRSAAAAVPPKLSGFRARVRSRSVPAPERAAMVPR